MLAASSLAAAQTGDAPVGIGTVTVHSQFGGQIFGFDIDQNGTEGLLTEAQTLSNGNTLNAIESDQGPVTPRFSATVTLFCRVKPQPDGTLPIQL